MIYRVDEECEQRRRLAKCDDESWDIQNDEVIAAQINEKQKSEKRRVNARKVIRKNKGTDVIG